MAFYKTAEVRSIGTALFDAENGLKRVAFATSDDSASTAPPQVPSYYVDGARKIDIRGILEKVAEKYKISDNPTDYIFEAIRANTTNVPNENHDAFHKNELLRFDTRLGMPVYMTYIAKPHHLNHNASDPKRAQGVILDSHYNDDAPALPNCPTCLSKTASEEDRDVTGLHCKKCGSVVKDEFVEILVAVDRVKAPELVRGIQAGLLNAGSMGCGCSTTSCNVCDHTARTVSDFCKHIKGSAKGSLWLKEGSEEFKRITSEEAKKYLKAAGYKTDRRQDEPFIAVKCAGVAAPHNGLGALKFATPGKPVSFEIRKAFENCQGVEFEEYSRVHRPADPKARTTELLKAASSSDNTELSLEEETAQLIRRAQLEREKSKIMSRTATASSRSLPVAEKTFYAVRVNGNDEDFHVAASLREAIADAQPGKRDSIELTTVKAANLTSATVAITRTAQWLPIDADVSLVIPDGAAVNVDQPLPGQEQQLGPDGQPLPMPGQMPGMPGQMPGDAGKPMSVEDVTKEQVNPESPEQSPEEFGILPPGAGDEGEEPQDMMNEQKYASVYGDLEVVVHDRSVDVETANGDVVFSFPKNLRNASSTAKYSFGGEVIQELRTSGLVRTAAKFGGAFNKRFADITEGAAFDHEMPATSSGGILADADRDQDVKMPDAAGTTQDHADRDQDVKLEQPKSLIQDRETDQEGSEKSDAKSITEGAEEDIEEKRMPYKMTDSTQDGAVRDIKAAKSPTEGALEKDAAVKTVEARLQKLYASRFKKLQADLETERQTIVASTAERFKRAMKIVASRQQLNIETSPLKAKLVDSLTVTRPVGRSASSGAELEWTGMDEDLALHLVEAAYAESAGEDIDALIERTAEWMAYDDSYLLSAEKDLKRQAALVPALTSERQLQPQDSISKTASALRAQAVAGNFNLVASRTDSDPGLDKQASIREALSSTPLGRLMKNVGDE